ncbi:unnamed protein product [Amoebophrya sp. A25]|nr:unnamed protein product [Amoebophrya sp. A25]|eukprot:GSA25T00023822001.1
MSGPSAGTIPEDGMVEGFEDAAGRSFMSIEQLRKDALSSYILNEKGGQRVISRILIASNGLAAVKAIRSMRRWEVLEVLKTRGNLDKCLTFVSMATPEDIAANAQFLQMVDSFVEVPGGKNLNNYANIELICKVAVQERCDAVWPGWGHASEKPELPEALAKHGITFLGPQPRVMRLLGDKIYANIMAQTAGVPCIPWSGDGLISKDVEKFTDLDDLFHRACCHDAEAAVKEAERIGFPVMLKASEGGGGKGIRKCLNAEDVRSNYQLCQMEVIGSPIFIMKYSAGACHLEVQLLGDEHGNVCSLSGRDCSTQRRFQKIFEEGPPTVADPDVFHEMQMAACRLAKQVGYRGAGTVEYLYDPKKKAGAFLELNPRLQVEHPVTECITGVNIPAAQLQIGMGVPLHRITDVRRYFLRGSEEEEDGGVATSYGVADVTRGLLDTRELDFTRKVPVYRHCIAARITAENPEDGFLPCSGKIRKVDFSPTHESVWGYFSVATPGAVHEFADSQFGHVFSIGRTREAARKALIISLQHLHVEGEIRTTVDVLPKLLKLTRFVDNQVDTAWLDGLITNKDIARLMSVPTNLGPGAANENLVWDTYSDVGSEDQVSMSELRYDHFMGAGSATGMSTSAASPSGPLRGSPLSSVSNMPRGARAGRLGARSAGTSGSMDHSLSMFLNCDDFVLYAALGKALHLSQEKMNEFKETLGKGQMVHSFLPVYLFPEIVIVWNQIRYTFHITRFAENRFAVRCKDDNSECQTQVKEHQGAYFIRAQCGKVTTPATKVVCTMETLGTRLRIGAMSGYEVFVPNVTDPSELRSDVQGRLIRFLVSEGDEIEKGQVCCELEAMKMIVPVKARYGGKVQKLVGSTNAVVGTGDLLLKLELSGAGAGAAPQIKRYSSAADGRPLFAQEPLGSSQSRGGAKATAGTDKVVHQEPHAVLQGFPKYGAVRLPDSVDEGLSILTEFLATDRHFFQSANPESPGLAVNKMTTEQVLHQMLRTGVDLEQIYRVFFARAQLHARLGIILELLAKFDSKLLVTGKSIVRQLAELPERYGEVGLKCKRLLRENARNYVNLNTLMNSREWMEHTLSTDASEVAQSPNVPATKTLMSLVHLLSTSGADGAAAAAVLSSIEQGSAPSGYNQRKFQLRSRAVELLVHRVYRGYEALSVGTECIVGAPPPTSNSPVSSLYLTAFTATAANGNMNNYTTSADKSPTLSGYEYLADTSKENSVSVVKSPLGSSTGGGALFVNQFVLAARQWNYRYPGVASTFSGFGSFIPGNSGLCVVVSSLAAVRELLRPAALATLLGVDNPDQNEAALDPFNQHRNYQPPSRVALGQQDAGMTINELWILYSGEVALADAAGQEEAGSAALADAVLDELNANEPGLRGAFSVHSVTLSFTAAGGFDGFQFVNRRANPLARLFAESDTTRVFVEDVLARNTRPSFPHLLEITEQLREKNPIRIGPELSAQTMALLNRNTIEVRTVSYESLLDPETDAEFCLPIETTLSHALDELARARLDSRVAAQPSSRIFINLLTQLAFSPEAVMRGYEASLLSALSGFVKRFLKYRVDVVEIKLRLKSGENLRLVASSEAEYLQPKAYLEYLNPITGEVMRSVDLPQLVAGLPTRQLGSSAEALMAVGGEQNALARKRTTAHQAGSTYVYDFPHLLRMALVNRFQSMAENGETSGGSIAKRGGLLADIRSSGLAAATTGGANAAGRVQSPTSSSMRAASSMLSLSSLGGREDGNGPRNIFSVVELVLSESGPPENAGYGGANDLAELLAKNVDAEYIYSDGGVPSFAPRQSPKSLSDVLQRAATKGSTTSEQVVDGSPGAGGSGQSGTYNNSPGGQQSSTSMVELLQQHSLYPVSRPVGTNSVGMICWVVHMRTPEFPDGRFFVLVANDITHKAGSFGVPEDRMYQRAAEFARATGLPFVYISANSGARVGMVDGLENAVKPHFSKDNSATAMQAQMYNAMPSGFEYWYLDQAGYDKFKEAVEVKEIYEVVTKGADGAASSVEQAGANAAVSKQETVLEKKKRYQVTAIVGGDGIGVENLKGSAMIAGETCRAYRDTFTLSYVTGRSVGIGAYVNRLGSRVIQQRHGPMILTGFSALNKLLGRQVYTSQDQLGGPQVMCPNGVTHLLVENDQEGCERILEWLSFVPKKQNGPLPILPVPVSLGGNSPTQKTLSNSSTTATTTAGTSRRQSRQERRQSREQNNVSGTATEHAASAVGSFSADGTTTSVSGAPGVNLNMNIPENPFSGTKPGRAISLDTSADMWSDEDEELDHDPLDRPSSAVAILSNEDAAARRVRPETVQRAVTFDPCDYTTGGAGAARNGITATTPGAGDQMNSSSNSTAGSYDPRMLLQGTPDGHFSGFLDRGSFVEVLAQWGKTVVVGRGRLGGIPMGCIAVETRVTNRSVMPDPANLDSKVQEDAQAGQVWFPDSAYKTASAIRDFNKENLPLIIFANWRGFSGGTRDMYNEILKFGAQIVDALVAYEAPVFVYVPPGGELRGGAWVVIDPAINPDFMEMYADRRARGGILEPAGAIDVKLRPPTLMKMMNRCDGMLSGKRLEPAMHKRREELLMPLYQSMALHFADLHDRAPRMKRTGCIREILDWRRSREFFYWRVKRRLAECAFWRRAQQVLGTSSISGGGSSCVTTCTTASSTTTGSSSSTLVGTSDLQGRVAAVPDTTTPVSPEARSNSRSSTPSSSLFGLGESSNQLCDRKVAIKVCRDILQAKCAAVLGGEGTTTSGAQLQDGRVVEKTRTTSLDKQQDYETLDDRFVCEVFDDYHSDLEAALYAAKTTRTKLNVLALLRSLPKEEAAALAGEFVTVVN